MTKFKLKVNINQINVETWKQILWELYLYGVREDIIDLNESNTFSWFYSGDFISAVHAVQKSSHYDILDEYVLFNINTKNVVSGDGEYIIDRLEKNKKKYISTLLSYLNNGAIFYSYWMRPIIEEC